tara:strand:+ start:153 stop:2510 length:2358 start_codon:yes stop_codon:yes gene_type:complete
MNNNSPDLNNFQQESNSFDIIKEFYRYLFFWRYFLASVLIFLFLGFVINKYTSRVYDINAKIQILDKKQNNLEMPSAEDLFKSSKINLENEIEIIKSSPILNDVIKNLNLNYYVESVGDILTTRTLTYPFNFYPNIKHDSTRSFSYELILNKENLEIINLHTNIKYQFINFKTLGVSHDLPFEITNVKKDSWQEDSYNLNYEPNQNLISYFKKSIEVTEVGKQSDIINLNFQNTNFEYAKIVLDEIINVFNKDGIRDRQLIHKRTIDFVNERYKYLYSELESIELEKQSYKINNNLVDISVNSGISLEKNLISEQELFSNENQIFLINNLLEELESLDFELLPSNIGIENIEVNSLVSSFNNLFLERQKLNISAGSNNPYVKQLNVLIEETRNNIIYSLKNYRNQLNILNDKLTDKSNIIQGNVLSIPLQEKNLRSIERNQQIKEELYLFLLQKLEEAQVSFAVTEPSIKVVEYANCNKIPISPNTRLIFLAAIFLGFFVPFGILYFIFLFDTKVHSREDLEEANLNVLGEIPFFDSTEKEKVFNNSSDRSIISESFRMLMSNVRYLEKKEYSSNVILVTSSIKGEGKTLNALNLALSFSSVGKKILLIGCDLRNPQLHKYIDYDKNTTGLVDFLVDNKVNWKKSIIKPFIDNPLDILLSGPLPPNPLNLINNGNIDLLLKEARENYDYIIIDSAPTLLVADTKSIYDKADILLFLTRNNVTDKNVLHHIFKTSNEINANVGVVLNGVGQKNSYGYSYGYKYGYGYSYKYSYNYGYGYGYNEDKS